MASNELKELNDETHCDCEFFRKYQLPCRDIWAQHQLFGTLKEEDFDRWAFMCEDSGFELYEGITSEYYERGIDGEIGAPATRRLDMREALDIVRSKYYDLEESVEHLPPAEADRVMKWWIAKLETITGSLRSIGIADFQEEVQAKHGVVEGAKNPLGGGLYDCGYGNDGSDVNQ